VAIAEIAGVSGLDSAPEQALNSARNPVEASMHDYEIRILKENSKLAALIAITGASDEAIIREAKRIAQDRPMEIWREVECIYRSAHAMHRAA
jgi:hypothetical protein